MAPSSTTTTRARSRRARLDRRTIAVCVAVAAVAAALSAVLVAGAVGDGGEATAGLERSRPAPTLSFGRFDGSTGSVADYRGQKLVVNFFSSTCVPCKREMPALEQVQREAGDEITVLGIDVQDTPEAGRAMVRQTGVTYDIGRDPNGTLFNRFGATLLPATAFVDTDGTLLDLHTGALTARQLRAKISATLLGGGLTVGGGRFALAFAAGMVATVNPCGFAMLPAYLGWFISGDSDGDGAGAPRPATTATVLRAVVVATVVASGFVAVFGTAGALLSWFSVSLYSVTPWVTVVIGLGLVAVGIALVAGWQPTVALPKLERGTSGRGLRSMFLFGVSYAVASVSCTLPVFVAQVSNTFGRSFASGVGVFLTFTLGMAVVLVVLSVAVALARQSLVAAVRRAVRYVNRVAGALLVVTGAYVAWYGGYEIRSADRAAGADAAVDRVTGWSSTIANLVQDIGALRLGLVGALLVGAALAVTYVPSASKRDSSSSSSSP